MRGERSGFTLHRKAHLGECWGLATDMLPRQSVLEEPLRQRSVDTKVAAKDLGMRSPAPPSDSAKDIDMIADWIGTKAEEHSFDLRGFHRNFFEVLLGKLRASSLAQDLPEAMTSAWESDVVECKLCDHCEYRAERGKATCCDKCRAPHESDGAGCHEAHCPRLSREAGEIRPLGSHREGFLRLFLEPVAPDLSAVLEPGVVLAPLDGVLLSFVD